ncbi:MAG: hypothetical protein ACPG7F_02555 [Aggregatilineales bacterium]
MIVAFGIFMMIAAFWAFSDANNMNMLLSSPLGLPFMVVIIIMLIVGAINQSD